MMPFYKGFVRYLLILIFLSLCLRWQINLSNKLRSPRYLNARRIQNLLTSKNSSSRLFTLSDTKQSKFQWNDGRMINPSFTRIQQQRKKTLKKACVGRTVRFPFFRSLIAHSFYSKSYNFSMCYIHKCGYSSWLFAFLIMENVYTWKNLKHDRTQGIGAIEHGQTTLSLERIYQERPLTMVTKWNESFKAITVRHPFARLLSAYNDKFSPNNAASSFYKKLGRKIEVLCRDLRSNPTLRNNIYETPLFEDFINYVLYFGRKHENTHWIPFYKQCFPCFGKFDVIIKFETLQADIGNLTHILGISANHKIGVFPKVPFNTTEAKVKAAFEKLPKHLVNQLYEKYRPDFEIFGYKRPHWLD